MKDLKSIISRWQNRLEAWKLELEKLEKGRREGAKRVKPEFPKRKTERKLRRKKYSVKSTRKRKKKPEKTIWDLTRGGD